MTCTSTVEFVYIPCAFAKQNTATRSAAENAVVFMIYTDLVQAGNTIQKVNFVGFNRSADLDIKSLQIVSEADFLSGIVNSF